MAQHLVQDTTLSLKIMQTLSITLNHTLVVLIHSLGAQRTEEQSWLGLIGSHLMRWRFSILVENEMIILSYPFMLWM